MAGLALVEKAERLRDSVQGCAMGAILRLGDAQDCEGSMVRHRMGHKWLERWQSSGRM